MKLEDLKKKSITELHKALKEARSDLSKLKIEIFEKKEKNFRKVNVLKKDIARIMTLLKVEERKNG